MTSLRNIVATLTLGFCIYIPVRGDEAVSTKLPPGVVKALAKYEKEYCEEFLGDFRKGCHQKFRSNLLWRPLVITPSGQTAFLVENYNTGFCGSAGCDLYLFASKSTGKFTQVFGTNGDTGTLESITVLNAVTKDHYNIQKTWSDGKTHTLYLWDGSRYSWQ
ncbi:MAG: hypothetical protein WCD49_02910 [Candidatus Acidiferrales bacterium]